MYRNKNKYVEPVVQIVLFCLLTGSFVAQGRPLAAVNFWCTFSIPVSATLFFLSKSIYKKLLFLIASCAAVVILILNEFEFGILYGVIMIAYLFLVGIFGVISRKIH